MAFARKHKNFNFVVDGISQVGQVTEVVLPKITRKMEDFQAGGMDAPV